MLATRLEAALDRLPLSTNEVAQFLIDRGITGVRDECTACPLSRWLRKELHVPMASVDITLISIIDDQGNMAGISPPAVVARFVGEFDHDERFPELVDENGMSDEEVWDLGYSNQL